MKKRKLLFIVGSDGAGKTYTANILNTYGDWKKLITTTNRSPRDGEKDGIDYNFVDHEYFYLNDFIESNMVGFNLYGLEEKIFMDGLNNDDKDIVIVLDASGVYNVCKWIKENKDRYETVKDLELYILHLDVPKHIRFDNIVKQLKKNWNPENISPDPKANRFYLIESAMKRLNRVEDINTDFFSVLECLDNNINIITYSKDSIVEVLMAYDLISNDVVIVDFKEINEKDDWWK